MCGLADFYQSSNSCLYGYNILFLVADFEFSKHAAGKWEMVMRERRKERHNCRGQGSHGNNSNVKVRRPSVKKGSVKNGAAVVRQ